MSRIEKAISAISARVAREGHAYLYEREGMSARAHHVVFALNCIMYKQGFYMVQCGDRIEVKRAQPSFFI